MGTCERVDGTRMLMVIPTEFRVPSTAPKPDSRAYGQLTGRVAVVPGGAHGGKPPMALLTGNNAARSYT